MNSSMLAKAFLFFALVAIVGCGAQPSGPEISLEGTVRYITLEGGYFVVEAEDGKHYNVEGQLPANLQTDGQIVSLEANRVKEPYATFMTGIQIEVISVTASRMGFPTGVR